MSIIAWQAGIIAADKQSTHGDFKVPTSKLHQVNQEVITFVGPLDFGEAMLNWYKNGAIPEEFPSTQSGEDFATLIVASPSGIYQYQQTPLPIKIYAPYMAWGAGAPIAMGAMAAGKSAIEAVKIANQLNIFCGFGVDSIYISML